MDDLKSVTPPPKQDIHLPLVIRAKVVRVIVASLITLAILVAALILDLHEAPSLPGEPHYREVTAVLIVVLMPVSVAIFYAARRVTKITLTEECLQTRIPGWLIRTLTIPLPDIRRADVEKREYAWTIYGGSYYRDYLVITYRTNDTRKVVFMQVSAYHSREIRALLTTLKQLAPHVKYDANIRRFLNLDE